jgi:hypothetical protein
MEPRRFWTGDDSLPDASPVLAFSPGRCFGESDYYHRGFNFGHVQMALRMHRRGLDADRYLEKLSLALTDGQNPLARFGHQLTFQARIMPNFQ